MWFQPHRAQKVFTLFSEALDELRAEAKCTAVYGRRINIFLYSLRTHFSSVKHVLIINLFNTHTASAGYNSHPPIQTDEHSCRCLSVLYRSGIWEDVFIFSSAAHRQRCSACWHTVWRHTCTKLHVHALLQNRLCLRGEVGPDYGPTFPMYSSSVNKPNGDCVN